MVSAKRNVRFSLLGQYSFDEISTRGKFCDVTIATKDSAFQAHKVILAAHSPELERLIEASSHPKPLILLRDTEGQDLKNVLQFFYDGVVNVSLERLQAVLKLAKDLKIDSLVEVLSEPKTPEAPSSDPRTPVPTVFFREPEDNAVDTIVVKDEVSDPLRPQEEYEQINPEFQWKSNSKSSIPCSCSRSDAGCVSSQPGEIVFGRNILNSSDENFVLSDVINVQAESVPIDSVRNSWIGITEDLAFLEDSNTSESLDIDSPSATLVSTPSKKVHVIFQEPMYENHIKTLKDIIQQEKEKNKLSMLKGGKRRRCVGCKICNKPDCNRCKYCLDMVKNGGPGRLRQKCLSKKCF